MKNSFQVHTVLEAGGGGGAWVQTLSFLLFFFVFVFFVLLQQSEGILRLGMCEHVIS